VEVTATARPCIHHEFHSGEPEAACSTGDPRIRNPSNFGGGSAHIMEADLVAGKRYYVLLRFIYANGMQLRPIRPTGPSDFAVTNKDFPEWVSITHFVDKTPAADVREHTATIDAALARSQADGLAEWAKKTPAQRAELTLNATDAIDR
jgi:hypothetical protein